MRYPTQIIKLAGVNADLPPSELPIDVYSDAQNMRYNRLAMEKVGGHAEVFGTGMLHTPYHALWTRQAGVEFWIYGGEGAVSVVDEAGTHYDITPIAGVTADYDDNWTGGQLNGIPYLSNPNQDPIFWDGVTSNEMDTIPNWPASTKAAVVRTYNNQLIALDLTESSVNYPTRIRWSSSADAGSIPNSWDATNPALDAGVIELGGTQGRLIDCLPLYESNIVYKNNSTFAMTYIGGNTVFNFRMIFPDTGIMARNCVAAFQGRHVVITNEDIIIHDGNTKDSLLDKRMRNWFFSQIDKGNKHRSFVVPYYARDEIWFCIPTGSAGTSGLPNKALIWNYRDNAFGVRDLPSSPFIAPGIISQYPGVLDWGSDDESWESDSTAWDDTDIGSIAHNLLMCAGANLYQIDVGDYFDTDDFVSYVERLSMPLSDNYTETKLIRAVWPNITGSQGVALKIRVGGQMFPDDPVQWSSEEDYVIGTNDKVDTYIKARLISIRISSESGMHWAIHGMALEVKTRGRW